MGAISTVVIGLPAFAGNDNSANKRSRRRKPAPCSALVASRRSVMAGRAPALERGPDGALQPKAVERRRRVEGADTEQAHPAPLEAAFFQHPARRRVADTRTRDDHLVAEVRE